MINLNEDFDVVVEQALAWFEENKKAEIESGYTILTPFSRWSIEQAITNRREGVSMGKAARDFYEEMTENSDAC